MVVAHEVWPGRHVQAARARQLASEVRRRLTSSLTTNGWALYAQELMAEEGYYTSLETRLMHLVGMLRYAVQVDLDIGLHTRGMTPAGGDGRTGQTRAGDQAPGRDGSAPVLRVAGERDFRTRWGGARCATCVTRRRTQRGADYSPGAFHDEVLSYGGIPVSLIRWGMGID